MADDLKQRGSPERTTASIQPATGSFLFADDLSFFEWSRRFHRHLRRLLPKLSVLDRAWTVAHWLHRWDLHSPERAACESAGWWSSPSHPHAP